MIVTIFTAKLTDNPIDSIVNSIQNFLITDKSTKTPYFTQSSQRKNHAKKKRKPQTTNEAG
jgi:hypothetical protein